MSAIRRQRRLTDSVGESRDRRPRGLLGGRCHPAPPSEQADEHDQERGRGDRCSDLSTGPPALRALDDATHGRHRLNPTISVLLQAALQELADSRRGLGRQSFPVRFVGEHGGNGVGCANAAKRPMAGEQFIEHAAERPDVGSMVHVPAARLLRAHVRRRAHDVPCVGHLRGTVAPRLRVLDVAVSRDDLGQAEIQNLHGSIWRDLDICRLQITMDDASVVRRLQSSRDLTTVFNRRATCEGTFENLALHQFQHQVVDTATLFNPVDRRDVRMIE